MISAFPFENCCFSNWNATPKFPDFHLPFQKAAEFRFVLAIDSWPKKRSWKIWPFCIDLPRSQHVWLSFAAMFVVRPGAHDEISLKPTTSAPLKNRCRNPKRKGSSSNHHLFQVPTCCYFQGGYFFFVEHTLDDDHLWVDFADAKPIMAFGIFVAPLAHSSWARYPRHSTSKQHQKYYCPLMEEQIRLFTHRKDV